MTDQLNLGLRIDLERNRADFVVSPENAAAVARLDAWTGGVLVIVGAAGVGKSHLAQSWARRRRALNVDATAAHDALIADPGAMLFEDADRARADELLFHLINRAERPGGALLLTSRTPPSAWTTALADLRSRLNAAPVLELAEPDQAALEQLLRRFFRERSISPSAELLTYLARRIERSASGARCVVAALDEAAHARGRPVTRSLARDVLERETLSPTCG